MLVAELMEAFREMPDTATVVVRIRKNVSPMNGVLDDLYEFRDVSPDAVLRSRDIVIIQLDE